MISYILLHGSKKPKEERGRKCKKCFTFVCIIKKRNHKNHIHCIDR